MAKKRTPTRQTKRASSLHSPSYEAIINFLIASREEQGISQSELGRRLHLSQPHLSALERCGRNLTIIELLDIVEILSDGDAKKGSLLMKQIHSIYNKARKHKH